MGSNFQHPRARDHSRSCSLNLNKPGDAIVTTKQFLSLRSIKNNNWSADNLKNMSPRLFVHYSQRYSHVTLVSGYLFENIARLSANQSVHTIAFSQVKEKGFTDKLEWYFINVLGNAFKFDSKSFIKKNRSKFVVVSCHHSSANKSSSFFFTDHSLHQ